MEVIALYGWAALVEAFQWFLGKSYRSSPTPYNKWAGSSLWKNKFGGNSELVAPLGARGAKRTTVVAFDAIAGFGCGDRGQFVLSRWRAAWAKNRGRSDESTQRSKNSSDRTRKIKGENWNCFYSVSMAYVVFERIHIWSNVRKNRASCCSKLVAWRCSLDKTQIKT